MAGKLLIGIGLVFLILGSVIYFTQMGAVQMATTSFEPSVQQYAHDSAQVGMVISSRIIGFGGLLSITGAILLGVRAIRKRRALVL